MQQRTRWFTEARFGMFIHFGLYSILGRGEWYRSRGPVPDEEYRDLKNYFRVDRWDPEAWAELAKTAGCRYSVMTAKHHDGFCLFDTAHTSFCSQDAPVHKDLIAGYLKAFREAGLQAGLYYSLIDWEHPDYTIDGIHPRRPDPAGLGQPIPYDPEPERNWEKYREYMFAQIRELLENYGKIPVMWFDFSYREKGPAQWDAKRLLEMIRQRQPDILLNSRLDVGHLIGRRSPYSGDFFTPEQFLPDKPYRDEEGNLLPWEVCMTLNDNWGYSPNDHNYKSSAEIIHKLVKCVSLNGNMLINVGPTPRGDIPPEACQILKEIGSFMAYNGESIYGCGPADLPVPEWGCWTRNGKLLYAHVFQLPVTALILPHMAGKIQAAELLRDGTRLDLSVPWMFAERQSDDAYVSLPARSMLSGPDVVVKLYLK